MFSRLGDLDHLDRPDDVLDLCFLLRAAGEPERRDDEQSRTHGRNLFMMEFDKDTCVLPNCGDDLSTPARRRATVYFFRALMRETR